MAWGSRAERRDAARAHHEGGPVVLDPPEEPQPHRRPHEELQVLVPLLHLWHFEAAVWLPARGADRGARGASGERQSADGTREAGSGRARLPTHVCTGACEKKKESQAAREQRATAHPAAIAHGTRRGQEALLLLRRRRHAAPRRGHAPRQGQAQHFYPCCWSQGGRANFAAPMADSTDRDARARRRREPRS